jgi:hypothetical protein
MPLTNDAWQESKQAVLRAAAPASVIHASTKSVARSKRGGRAVREKEEKRAAAQVSGKRKVKGKPGRRQRLAAKG